jgi:prepilin signal peptidase PulO-like enzyme (type II secretory pathway)
MFSFAVFVLGLSVGSFLNVVICRLQTKELILFSRSHCPKCRAVLRWYDLIPVLSFLIQRGKCRYCGKRISWQYPIVEISTACLFLLIFNFKFLILNEFLILNFINLFYYFFIVSLLIIIFVYDLKHYIIPDKIVYPAILVSGIWLLLGVLPGVLPLGGDFLSHAKGWTPILAALLASGFFLSLVLVSQGKWLGLGDVKLAFLMGLILGWPNILLALFLAFFSGAIVGIGLIVAGKKNIKSEIPFGPFLAGATIIAMFCPGTVPGLFVDNFVLFVF